MATRKETVRVCDQCGKEKRFETDGGYCGGHPLQGWVHVSEHGGSTRLAELERKKEHDYCSWKCLAESLQNVSAHPRAHRSLNSNKELIARWVTRLVR